MKVPVKWLSEFVETGLSPAALAERLTMAGLAAEKIEQIGAEWDKVYVGLVTKVEPHPDADRLVLATVAAGDRTLTVVTGAPNIAAGQKVALAIAGARLIDAHHEGDEAQYKTLKPGTIRGVRSEGMVCSEKELGISEEHEGIMVLDAEAPVGVPLPEWLGETVIEFEITPNRVDAFSVLGIAREAAALTGRPLTPPRLAALGTHSVPADSLVRVEAPELCARCTATVIEGVQVGPSPSWLVRRLAAAGLRPINNLVDATNYVMLEMGQPLHAYDRDRLAGGRIVVRRARSGERVDTLNHQRRDLTPDMLVIADDDHVVGVAGVMGGLDSEVDSTTTTILLEAAHFHPSSVRQTARALKLRSDASARFERGLDPTLAASAAARATELILALCRGSRLVAFADLYPTPLQPSQLAMPFAAIARLLGVRYETADVTDVLGRLGFQPTIEGVGEEASLRVLIPTFRPDVTQPADMVEEVARAIGYETLPETLPTGRATAVRRDPIFTLQRKLRQSLVAAGGFEAITYVTASTADLARLGTATEAGFLHRVPVDELIRLRNPLQAEQPWLRPTLLPGLLAAAASNLKHETGVRLFELARVYLPRRGETLPHEANLVGLVFAGRRDRLGLYGADGDLDFFDLKGAVEALMIPLGLTGATFQATSHPALHPGRAASLRLGDRELGLLGELHPDCASGFGIETPRVAVAELDLDALLAAGSAAVRITVPHFLPVEQDFAVVVDETTAAADVAGAMTTAAGPLLTGLVLFDVYRGPQVGEGKKSLAYRLTFTAPDRALTDAEMTKTRDKIGKLLARQVGGELRV